MIRYILIAILIYLAYLIIRMILRNVIESKARKKSNTEKKNKRAYNLNEVQDAEFREVKKD